MVDENNLDIAPKSSTLPQTLGADLSGLYESIYKKPMEEKQKAQESYAKEAGDIGVQRAEIKAKPAQQFADQYAGISKKYEPELMAKAPEFKVDQTTASGIASMAALLPIAGALFGGKGQMSGIGALQAMNGVLKGYQAGNKERIDFEKTKFEKELQNFKMHQDRIQKAFDRAVQGAKVNLTGAQAGLERDLAALDAKNLLAIAKRDGVVAAQDQFQKFVEPISKEIAKNLPSVMAVAPGTSTKLPREIVVNGEKRMATPEQERALIASGTPYTIPPKEKTQSDAYGFNDIIAVAANEAAGSITNIMNLPEGSTTGAFQGQNTKGLFSAPLGALANTLTSEDTQRYNAEIANFGRYLAQVTKGGRNVTNADVEKNQAQFAVREGDSALTVLTRIGQMRQSLERALEVKIASEKTPASLKEIYKARLAEIQEAIPFTVNDVNKIRNEKDQTKTFTDMIGEAGLGKDKTKIVDVSTADEAEKLPPGTKFRLPDGRSGTVQ